MTDLREELLAALPEADTSRYDGGTFIWGTRAGWNAARDAVIAILDRTDTPPEVARLREALVESVLPLEVIAAQDRDKPYRELSRDFIDTINEAIRIARGALTGIK